MSILLVRLVRASSASRLLIDLIIVLYLLCIYFYIHIFYIHIFNVSIFISYFIIFVFFLYLYFYLIVTICILVFLVVTERPFTTFKIIIIRLELKKNEVCKVSNFETFNLLDLTIRPKTAQNALKQ